MGDIPELFSIPQSGGYTLNMGTQTPKKAGRPKGDPKVRLLVDVRPDIREYIERIATAEKQNLNTVVEEIVARDRKRCGK
jgi:hypothetical protein